MRPTLAVWLGCALAPVTLPAQGAPGAPDRRVVEPIVTEETLPNEPGERDVRLTSGHRRFAGGMTLTETRLHLFYGIRDRLGGETDVVVRIDRDAGRTSTVGALGASLKWLVVEPEERPWAAVLGLELEAPVGGAAAGAGEPAFEVTPFVAGLLVAGRLTAQGNVGLAFERARGAGATDRGVAYNLAVATAVSGGRVHLFGEINGRAGLNDEPSEASLAPGIKYQLREEFTLAAAVPVGLARAAADWGVVVQIQWGF